MTELWQLYSEDGQPLVGKGATKDETFKKGLLHGAAHVWVWRRTPRGVEVLAQKRDSKKRTWPNTYDASSAGHVSLNESPLQTAVRETEEEIGLVVDTEDLQLVARLKPRKIQPNNVDTENEVRWIYFYELQHDFEFRLEANKVAALDWKNLEELKRELFEFPDRYLPQGDEYYQTLISALEKL